MTARNARISPSIKETGGETTNRIERFRNGEINLLIATSVIEEVGYKSFDLTSSLHGEMRISRLDPVCILAHQGF